MESTFATLHTVPLYYAIFDTRVNICCDCTCSCSYFELCTTIGNYSCGNWLAGYSDEPECMNESNSVGTARRCLIWEQQSWPNAWSRIFWGFWTSFPRNIRYWVLVLSFPKGFRTVSFFHLGIVSVFLCLWFGSWLLSMSVAVRYIKAWCSVFWWSHIIETQMILVVLISYSVAACGIHIMCLLCYFCDYTHHLMFGDVRLFPYFQQIGLKTPFGGKQILSSIYTLELIDLC